MAFDYDQLRTLSAILRNGSFEAAAAELGVTQSAISQRLKALEERCGMQLVRRGQPCTGTDSGRRIAAHVDNVGLLEQQLESDLTGQLPSFDTRLRVAVNADSLATWFIHALSATHGQLFDLVVDDQDFSADWLRKGEVVGAVTAHAKPVPGCDSYPLGSLRYLASASPAFAERWFASGVTRETLAQAPMLQFDQKDELQKRWISQHVGKNIVPRYHRIPSSQGFIDACVLELGWGMNPEALVQKYIEQGLLVEVLPNSHVDTPLYWQCPRILKPVLSDLTSAVRKTARLFLRTS